MKSDQYLLGRHRAEEDRLARQSLEYEGEARWLRALCSWRTGARGAFKARRRRNVLANVIAQKRETK